MSFTALLLPLRPHLTYYRYLAGGKKKSVQSFPPAALPGGTRCKYGTGRKTLARLGEQGLPASRSPPHWPGAALRSAQTRPTILGSTHIPRSPLAAPPPAPVSSAFPRLTSQRPQRAHTLTHLGRIWGTPPVRSALRSAASSSTNALGLFLRLPSSPARRRDPGRHRKVSLSHLSSALPRLQRGQGEARPDRPPPRTPAPVLGPPEVRAAPLGRRARAALLQGSPGRVRAARRTACSKRLRGCCRRPVPPPPVPLPRGPLL